MRDARTPWYLLSARLLLSASIHISASAHHTRCERKLLLPLASFAQDRHSLSDLMSHDKMRYYTKRPTLITMLLACARSTTSATPLPPPSPPPPMLCKNTCSSPFGNGGPQHVGNGLCQDGHTGAIGAQCDLGTDCDDCGPREYMPPPQSPPSPPSPPPPSPSPPSPSPPRRHLLRRRCCVRTSASRTRSGMEARTQTTRTARTGASRPSEPAARTARRLHRLRVPISS